MNQKRKKNNFDIDIAIINAVEYHNNRVLNSTGFKPKEIRHFEDELVINQVINNIVKSMKRKVDKDVKIKKNQIFIQLSRYLFIF